MENVYYRQAQKLQEAGMWVYGFGAYDLTTQEVADLLELLELLRDRPRSILTTLKKFKRELDGRRG